MFSILALAMLANVAASAGEPVALRIHRYWPRFPRPTTIVTTQLVCNNDEAFVLQSVSGLAARAALTGRNRELVWYPINHPAYDRWHADMLKRTRAREVSLPDVWAVVERFRKAGIVKGYVLFRHDTTKRNYHERGDHEPSPNVATVMAARLGGILVAEAAEARAKEMGLALLGDSRGVTEEECFERWGAAASRTVLAMIEPKVPHCRAEAIALNAFVLGTHGPLYERALARLEPDSPILAWGMGDEYHLTEPVSRWGSWQSATNWCLNLPALSTEGIGDTIPVAQVRPRRPLELWDLRWEENVHYASFLMTDGDNVQWLMGDFPFGGEKAWWNSPARGKFPMGWGTCAADLAQLCPYALTHLVGTATPRDDLVLLGGGYYYPDHFGKERKNVDTLRIHARRIRGYMRMTGMRVLHMNAAKWDCPECVRAYTTFAEEIPELEGMMMIQYAPYSAGQGKVLWVKRRDGSLMPVVSARFGMWAHSPFPDDGPPAEVARRINAMPPVTTRRVSSAEPVAAPAGPVPLDAPGFSWITVHCWSWFREVAPDAPEGAEEVDQAKWRELGAKRGLEPVEWCIRRLNPSVRVIKPTELLMLVNLRLQPGQTLRRGLADLEKRAAKIAPARRTAVAQVLADARAALGRGDHRRAFEIGRNAARLIGQPRR
jgi:hypothetical protein